MLNKKVEFENDDGHVLSGILDLPARPSSTFALFAHCFTCSKNVRSAANVSRALVEAGIGVLRFDFTGLGDSEGEFAETNFSSNVDDLLAATRFLEANYEAPALLVGHSLGGTAVLDAAGRVPSAVAVATIGSPAEPSHVERLLAGSREQLDNDGVAVVDIGGRPFTIRKQFLDDLAEHDLQANIASLRKALLIMHAPLDRIVDVDNASALFAAAKHPKSFISLDDADHLLSDDADSRYAGRVLAAWASRFLPDQRPDQDTRQAGSPGVVAKTAAGSFRTEIKAGEHALVADEPESFGGTDLGPSPYDLLGAALAACSTMTLQMYARHKQIGLVTATARVTHRKIHAEDCADCENDDGRIDEFRRELTLDGELDAAQRQRLLDIADRCPVHQTLHGEVKVRTTLE